MPAFVSVAGMFAAAQSLTYFQAIVIGLIQGVTELFPISSLGHSVLLPSLFGWNNVVHAQSQTESFFLAFLVGLHVATAIALLILYRDEWVAVIAGFFRSVRTRSIPEDDRHARMAWLIIVGTAPAAFIGLGFEHLLRVLFAKPLAAAIFLTVNGLVLLGGEYLRRRADRHAASGHPPRRALTRLRPLDGLLIGLAQSTALLAGISRSGVTMVGGLLRGLTHEDAVHFAFLLATPIIFGAGIYKIPDLLGPNGNGVRAQILVGSIAAGLAAYVSARFLIRWFKTRTLTPFGIYCLVFGTFCIVHFA